LFKQICDDDHVNSTDTSDFLVFIETCKSLEHCQIMMVNKQKVYTNGVVSSCCCVKSNTFRYSC